MPDEAHSQRLQCMDVWGGNRAVDSGVVMPGLDAWVYSRPFEGDAVGGDVHYVSSCATGRITRVLVADVSGHGSAVGDISDRLRRLMQRHSNYLDQTKFVRDLNRQFAGLNDTGVFATAIIATYWAPTRRLVISNAGHTRPLLYNAKERSWSVLVEQSKGPEPSNLPLGVMETGEYTELGVRLAPGDLVMFLTDSCVEARDASGAQLGEDGLIDLLSELDPSDHATITGALRSKLDAFRDGPPDDDMTILALRTNALAPRITWGERARAVGRFVRASASGPVPWPEFSTATAGGFFVRRLNNTWDRGEAPRRRQDP